MKKIILITTIISIISLLSISAFAQDGSDECSNLRFEAQDFICTLEAKLSESAAGTPAFREALKRKIDCQNSFLKTCKNEISNRNGTCELIKFQAQDLICNLEADESSNAAGTINFQNALHKKLECQKLFLETCYRELNN